MAINKEKAKQFKEGFKEHHESFISPAIKKKVEQWWNGDDTSQKTQSKIHTKDIKAQEMPMNRR